LSIVVALVTDQSSMIVSWAE